MIVLLNRLTHLRLIDFLSTSSKLFFVVARVLYCHWLDSVSKFVSLF